MAVVKLKYLRERPHLKAHLRYITHRRGRDEGSITRVLFNANGLTDRASMYELIDTAPRGTVFYKFMINLDPAKEDTHKDLDLVHITRQMVLALERQLGMRLPFAAVLHPADHTPLRHVHGIFLLPHRISKAAFRKLQQIARATATAKARLQRRARDRVRENPRNHRLTRSIVFTRSWEKPKALRSKAQGRAPLRLKPRRRGFRLRFQRGCSSCGFGHKTGLSVFLAVCPQCGRPLTRERQLHLRREVSI